MNSTAIAVGVSIGVVVIIIAVAVPLLIIYLRKNNASSSVASSEVVTSGSLLVPECVLADNRITQTGVAYSTNSGGSDVNLNSDCGIITTQTLNTSTYPSGFNYFALENTSITTTSFIWLGTNKYDNYTLGGQGFVNPLLVHCRNGEAELYMHNLSAGFGLSLPASVGFKVINEENSVDLIGTQISDAELYIQPTTVDGTSAEVTVDASIGRIRVIAPTPTEDSFLTGQGFIFPVTGVTVPSDAMILTCVTHTHPNVKGAMIIGSASRGSNQFKLFGYNPFVADFELTNLDIYYIIVSASNIGSMNLFQGMNPWSVDEVSSPLTAGGTITVTSKFGVIATPSLSIAPGNSFFFDVESEDVTVDSCVFTAITNYSGAGNPLVSVCSMKAGKFQVNILNTGSSAVGSFNNGNLNAVLKFAYFIV